MQLDGSFSVFDGWATLKELNIQRGTASSYNASATIAISDLGGKDVPCTFTYDKSKSSYMVKVRYLGKEIGVRGVNVRSKLYVI